MSEEQIEVADLYNTAGPVTKVPDTVVRFVSYDDDPLSFIKC